MFSSCNVIKKQSELFMPYFSSIGEKIVTQSVKLMQPIVYMVPLKPIECPAKLPLGKTSLIKA